MKEREKTPELERERRKGERMGSERERISEREKGTYGIRQCRQIKANNVCVRVYVCIHFQFVRGRNTH